MNCNEVRNELLAGTTIAPPAQAHLDECADCTALARALTQVEAGFATLGNLESPRRVTAAIRQRIAVEQGRQRRDLMVALDTVAATGVVISVATAAYRFYPEPLVIAIAICCITAAVLSYASWLEC